MVRFWRTAQRKQNGSFLKNRFFSSSFFQRKAVRKKMVSSCSNKRKENGSFLKNRSKKWCCFLMLLWGKKPLKEKKRKWFVSEEPLEEMVLFSSASLRKRTASSLSKKIVRFWRTASSSFFQRKKNGSFWRTASSFWKKRKEGTA